MHSSITSSPRNGRKARSVRASADASAPVSMAGNGGLEFIDGPEIQIACDQHLDPIALMFHDRRRNVDGAFQYFRHDILGRGWIDDQRAAAAAARLHGGLNGAVDHRYQHRGAEALPEMTVDAPGKTRAPQFIGAGRCQRHDDAARRARFVPQHEYARGPLLHLPASLAYEFGAALHQHDLTV